MLFFCSEHFVYKLDYFFFFFLIQYVCSGSEGFQRYLLEDLFMTVEAVAGLSCWIK